MLLEEFDVPLQANIEIDGTVLLLIHISFRAIFIAVKTHHEGAPTRCDENIKRLSRVPLSHSQNVSLSAYHIDDDCCSGIVDSHISLQEAQDKYHDYDDVNCFGNMTDLEVASMHVIVD